MLSLEGKQLGNYDVIRRIRVGGMGAVYEGRQRTAFDRRVAIKVILGDYAADRDMRRRFAREARTIARLHHPHILPLIEFGDEHGILYLVMPFIEGGTLTSYLRRSLPDLADVAAIYQQLLDAVEYAHEEGLIHRDIKSSNVLLDIRRSGPPYIYLADFGLVRTLRQIEDTSKTGKPIPLDQVPGTPHYMAPEQTRGIVTPLTDIYALGVLLYQLLTGELPYNDPDDIRVIQMHMHAPIPAPSKHDASIPPELDEIVRTAMAKRPEARYRNIAELRAAFLAALKGPVATILDDEPPALETYAATPQPAPLPQPRRPISTALSPVEEASPTPIIMPHRARNEPVLLAARAPRVKQRNTDTIKQKQRITEEPLQGRRKRLTLSVVALTVVTLTLLILLIMPRVLNVSLFPSGFPIFGTAPVAMVYVTAQTQTLQDSFVLTASPQVKEPDLATNTIPDRVVSRTATSNVTVKTTGTRTTGGEQAQGFIDLINSTDAPVTIPAQQVFTSTTGIQVHLNQDAQVPPRRNGQNGRVTMPAVAVSAGVAGNIPAHVLDGTCCNNGVTIRNPAPFSGGADDQTVHFVAQADLDSVKASQVPGLQQQIKQQIQKEIGANEVIADPLAYNVTTSSSSPVGTQIDRVQVTVKITGKAIIYDRDIAGHTAAQLLSKQATQKLGSVYKPQNPAQPGLVGIPAVRSGQNGIIYLNVTVHGIWVYDLTSQQMNRWPPFIKGSTTAAALAYLNQQPGVKSVQISLPFGADHLPSSIEQIKVVLVNPTS